MPGIPLSRTQPAVRNLCPQRVHLAVYQRLALESLRRSSIGGLRLATKDGVRIHLAQHLFMHRGHLRLDAGLHLVRRLPSRLCSVLASMTGAMLAVAAGGLATKSVFRASVAGGAAALTTIGTGLAARTWPTTAAPFTVGSIRTWSDGLSAALGALVMTTPAEQTAPMLSGTYGAGGPTGDGKYAGVGTGALTATFVGGRRRDALVLDLRGHPVADGKDHH